MKPRSPAVPICLLLVALPALGALAGRASAPALARMNHIVQVAECVWLEESQGVEERTLQSQAFRANALPVETLFQQAHEIHAKFRLGATLLGAWCGLILALKIAATLRDRGRRDYEADAQHCLSCGRCFASCPVEHKRLKNLVQ